jgi:glycosyltransferase involved in cell wall biosynthesis
MNNEVVRHGETGLLVTPDSPKQLAEAMQWTMTNPEKVLTMRSNSRKLAASYDVKWVLDNYLKPILSI